MTGLVNIIALLTILTSVVAILARLNVPTLIVGLRVAVLHVAILTAIALLCLTLLLALRSLSPAVISRSGTMRRNVSATDIPTVLSAVLVLAALIAAASSSVLRPSWDGNRK